ncbi:MAG: lipopolysaccharide biosynthesis protein [Candidatus Cloacimonetes bacterium]|nr:lipopolysaccharide biosynthesis protein [Candidatus Cloacimonadota bacterium]NLE06445.1 lipopolysaccharide biosynthesis protein [Thermoproteota archaeon]
MNGGIIASNFVWRFMERVCAQVVSLTVAIVLARLLEPSVFGIIAIVMIFINIMQVFVDSGLGTALIQKKQADDIDFSSVFYFNMLMCLIVYALIFIGAPLISKLYDNEGLTLIIRVVGLTVIASGIKSIQQSYVSRTMQFKKFFWSTLIGTIISAIIGILMAYKGMGVWALVAQSLSKTIIDTFILWLTVKWRPKLLFSFQRLKGLISYGWKILIASLISVIYANSRQLIIGKFYTLDDLAFYNKGNEFPNKIVPNVETAVVNILLPTVSQVQDDMEKVHLITRKAIKLLAYVISPMMIGMAACSDNLILVLLTEKWLQSVPFLRVFCIEAILWPLSAVLNNTIKAVGRSDLNLLIQIITRVIGIGSIFLVINVGPYAIAIFALIITILEFFIVSTVNKKVVGYSFIELFSDIFPSLILALVMGFCVYLIGLVPGVKSLVLLVQLLTGVGVYLIISIVVKYKPLYDILFLVKKKKG